MDANERNGNPLIIRLRRSVSPQIRTRSRLPGISNPNPLFANESAVRDICYVVGRFTQISDLFGAGSGGRTHKPSRAADFKSAAFADFAIPARVNFSGSAPPASVLSAAVAAAKR